MIDSSFRSRLIKQTTVQVTRLGWTRVVWRECSADENAARHAIDVLLFR